MNGFVYSRAVYVQGRSSMKHFVNKIKSLLNTSKKHLQVPILCYHSWTVGQDYLSDNHKALESDLKLLSRKGYSLLPVSQLVSILSGETPASAISGKKVVCITFDDGKSFDFNDDHVDGIGSITSFHTLLKQSQTSLPLAMEGERAVSFVIASPNARAELQRSLKDHPEQWQDDWWLTCANEGIIGIANHSWDHLHESVDQVRQRENKKGSFFDIDNYEDADGQILAAQEYINHITHNQCLPLFGYPYGHAPSYLRDEYFPKNGKRLGIKAAFSTAGEPVTLNTCIWDIPRYVCGFHWKSVDELERLLDQIDKIPPTSNHKHDEEPVVNTYPVESTYADKAEYVIHQDFSVAEVDDAEFFVGDLFRRRFFTDSFPATPRHFVAFARSDNGQMIPLGYVHYTMWENCALCGGLVIDDRQYRRLTKSIRSAIREQGGIAELLLQASFKKLPNELTAIWGHVGNPQSEVVCKRAGFLRTTDPYVMVIWRDATLSEAEKTVWLNKVIEVGPF